MGFKENESYLHKAAKHLLSLWLNEEEAKNDFCSFCGLAWRRNYGVYQELKFYETSDPYYFENSDGLIECGMMCRTNPDECFEPTAKRGKILFVPDITIFHKGQAMILIEIVHRSPVSGKKLSNIIKFFNGNHFELYTINAKSILVNTGKPSFLNFQQLH